MSEKLSDLLDQKISSEMLDDFLTDCKTDLNHVKTWQRYHIAKDMISNEISDQDLKFDVADNVMAKIRELHEDQNESVPNELKFDSKVSDKFVDASDNASPQQTKSKSRMWFPTAIAASLLAAVYFMVQPTLNSKQTVIEVAQSTVNQSMAHWQSGNDRVEDTLNALLVEHGEFTNVTGMNGLGTYSKFISYQKL